MSYQRTLEERLKFLNCDEETHRHLDEFRELLENDIDGALDYFYEKIATVPELTRIFAKKEMLEHARAGQRHHWLNVLFSKNFGAEHDESSSHIGQMHERVGLTIAWYLNSYCLMLNRFVRLAADHHHSDVKKVTRMIQEINKTVFLDMNYVIDSYLQSKDEALRRVLTRAEGFAAEIRDIDESLGKQARELSLQLASVASRLEGPGKDVRGVHSEVADAAREADQLAERIERLKQDLDTLQRQHKLQYIPARKTSLLAKLKGLFKS